MEKLSLNSNIKKQMNGVFAATQRKSSKGMSLYLAMAIIAVLAGGLYATPDGVPLVNGLGGSADFGENTLGRNDDGYSGSIDITSVFPDGLNFFGTVHTRLFVNNNGNITFNSGMSTYNPYGITGSTGNPIIAPFFDDIDTRKGVLTPSPGGTSTGSNLVYWDLDTENYVFTATWDDVGQYSNGTVPNAFQVRLHNRGGGNFDIEFRYETINWSKNGARAGWSSGNGTDYYEFPQSGNNSLMLNMDSDVGVYWFSVRSGAVSDVSMYPETLDFGDIEVGQTSIQREVVVSNSRDDALNLTSMILTGDASSNYIISGFSQGQTVEPGGSKVYQIAFAPQSLGIKNGFVELSFVCDGEADLIASSLLGSGTGKVLTVASDYGTASPTVGSHEFVPSTGVDASVGSPVVNGATRYVCTGWAGTGSVPADGAAANVSFVISQDSSITWNWATEYLLIANAQTGGNVQGNNQWYGEGADAYLTAVANSGYRFGEWLGDIDGCTIDGENITVPMTQPRQITASFIELLPPVAVTEQTYNISASSSQVVLDATGSYDLDNLEDGFDAIESLQWDLGNDGISDDVGRVNPLETVSLAQAVGKGLAIGVDLPVALTVYDFDGLSDIALTSISYVNSPPSCDAGSGYATVSEGDNLTLNGTADDPDLGAGVGEVLVYEWAMSAAESAGDFGGGFSSQLSPTLSHWELVSILGAHTGTIYLNVKDLSGQVASSSAQVSVELPDIAVSNLSCAPIGWALKPIDVSIDIANEGSSTLNSGWVIDFYLSDDENFSAESDTYCDSVSITESLSPQESTTLETQIVLPDNISGNKWLIAVADRTGAVVEYPDIDNNTAVSATQISTATDHEPPKVLFQKPDGLTHPRIKQVEIEFSEPVAEGSFTTAEITLTSPSSEPIEIESLTNTEENIWLIGFARQFDEGDYTLTISADVADAAGNMLDGNGDGIGGDDYIGTFEVTNEPIQTTLFDWTKHGVASAGNWSVASDGLSVFQSINGNPTFFISDFELVDSRFEGSLRVETTSDDDFIGFVFAFNDNDNNPVTLDSPFYLFSWKKYQQSSGGAYGAQGFKLVRVHNPGSYNFWGLDTDSNGTVLHEHTGNGTGWVSNVLYEFSLSYQPSEGSMRVVVKRNSDGVVLYNSGLIIDDNPLGIGRVGFYNYSQASVRYAGFTSATLLAPVAVPGDGYILTAALDEVVLDATASYDPDDMALGFDAISAVQWDLGDDGIEDDDGRTNALETVTLAQAIAKGLAIGTDLPVSLTVYDLDGLTDTDSTIISYANTAPTADAGSGYATVAYGGEITLNGVADDVDLGIGVGEVIVYEWSTSAAANAAGFGNGFSSELAPTLSHSELLGLLASQTGTLYFNVMDLSGEVASSSAEISVEVPNMAISSPNIYGYAYAGKPTTARYTVSNTGTCPVEGSWVDAVYLSDDDQIGGDTLIGTHSYGFPIGVGQSYNGEVVFTLPSGTPEGQKWLVIKTNSTGTVAETTTDDNVLLAGQIEIRRLPKIQAMANQITVAHEPYIGQMPVLEDGTPPITWSAVQKPHTSASVDPATGQFSWADPLPRLEPYTIKISAENDGGFDEKSWQLTVVRTPEINPIAAYTTASGISFTSSTPTLAEPTAVVWSLVSAPAGMTINASTGRVSWSSPVKEGSPHSITIKAENLAGSDTETFEVIVIDKPVITPISDDSVIEWTAYARSDITLSSGGDTTVVWSLIDRPAGMTIDSTTAHISWSNAIPSSSSYLVRVRAQNDAGYDMKTFYLTVSASPVIAGVGNEAISGTSPYSRTMTLVRGAAPITWSLQQSPAGMSINETTGVISWVSPVVSETAYTIIVGASNAIGSDTTQWNISVQQPPSIGAIDDVLINEGQQFNLLPQLLAGTSPISWALVRAPSGLTINNQTGELNWQSAVAGGPYEVVVQALNNVGSDSESFYINVPILYSASISTDTDVAIAGTPVTLNGNAYWIEDDSPAANVPVLIRIMLKGMRRTVTAQSDGGGNFSYTWTPFATEAGYYTIAADHPSVKTDTVQDDFNLYGLRISPAGMRHGVNINEPSSGSVSLRNLGDQQLTGISYTVHNSQSSAVELNVTSCPETLNGYGLGEIRYSITGLQSAQVPYTPSISITTDQGAAGILNFEIMVSQPQAVLEADISSIGGAMVRGKQRFVEFKLTNTGGSPTQPISVALPSTDFMTLVTPATMPALDVRQQATVTIKLEPAEDAPLNINTGSIAINAGNTGLSIPYNLACVSDLKGDLKIEATDDYTYNTAEAPKVFGASVVVKDPADGSVVYSGVTDAAGEIVFADIPEAYYTIEVKADSHGSFTSTVLAKGGETTFVSAFLPLNLVSYNWTVRPTQIEDHYTFTIRAVFETNVPAPVVTVEPALTDLEGMTEAEIQVNYTLTNNGLIAAEETDILFDGGNSNYEFIPLVDEIGIIPAKSSLVVPVLIRDLTKVNPLTPEAIARVEEKKLSGNKSLSCSVNVRSFVGYTWQCGPDRRWHKVPFYFKFPVLECTGGSTVSGGDNYRVYDGGTGWGWGSGTGSGGWGGGGWGWYVPPVYIPTGASHNFSTDASCNPCVDKTGKALLNCAISFLPLDCPATVVKGSYECGSDCYSGSMWACAKSCAGGIISTAASCGKDVIKKANPIGLAWNIFWCLWDVGTACLDGSSESIGIRSCCGNNQIQKMARITVSLSELTGEDITVNDTTIDYLLEQARTQASRIGDMFDLYTVILGSEVWFSGTADEDENEKLINWLEAFSEAMGELSPSAELIDSDEQQALLAMPLPAWVTLEDAQYAIDRWNNTVNYWQADIGSIEDVPQGQSTNFIPFNEFKDASQVATVAIEEQLADGFENLFEGESIVHNDIQHEVDNPSSGICARVKIEIKQEAVISRNAFEALLELSNDGDTDPLENVRVTVQVIDSSGADKTDLFGIHPPQLTGIDNVSGSGTLAASNNCSALWLIVPTQQAAPTEPVEYFVKGKLEYDFAGQQVSIPLYPAKINVMPNPNLVVHYFLEREVYSDDPFTDEIEPAVPFSLGLMMKNTGYGDAYNVRITSSQPEIIENEKGLLIDFEIIGTIVGSQPASPSLKVNLGDINAGNTAVAQWIMLASLQGKFIDYEASFEHIDGLGNPQLSLVESVDIHEMERVVVADYPNDDGKPDFLVNDIYDQDDMPDTLYNSDGNIYPVEAIGDATVDAIASPTNLEVVVSTPAPPEGWVYLRLDNPVPDEPKLALESVVRSDGKHIVSSNAWVTRKIEYRDEGDELKHFLHIFDYGGTGIYTVTYAPSDQIKPVVISVSADDVLDADAEVGIAVTYSDDVAIDTLSIGNGDIIVTGAGGFYAEPVFLNTDLLGDGTPRTGFYTLAAPQDGWTTEHNGTYTITLAAYQVRDTSYNYANSAVIGSFEVNIQPLDDPIMTLVSSQRISRTVYEYEYTLTVDNQTSKLFTDQLCRVFGLPPTAVITRDKVVFDTIEPDQAVTAPTTIKFRLDLSEAVDWNAIYFEYSDYIRGDVNDDGNVNIQDLEIVADSWLTSNPQADIYPAPYGDGFVDIKDFAEMARGWLR